ncbi:MAG: hypothetical protein R3D00_22165 [Bacteroidia bacterium]
MNQNLNWSLFDGDRFQRLCNALVIHDVSKHAKVFTAPGKDGGIDELYEGEYAGKDGKWRFQAKFHNTDKKTAFNTLKLDIKNDIEKNFQNEDHVIFLTNTDFLPQKIQELENLGKKVAKDSHDKEPNIEVWDGGKIEALLMGHPIIYRTFFGDRGAIIVPYREKFSEQLDPENKGPFNFHNPFAGRKDEIETLKSFLSNDKKSVISVVGSGGYGKTRLIVDFFRIIDREKPDWHCYAFLTQMGFDPSEFRRSLMGRNKFLILVDDAHAFSNLKDIVSIVRLPEFKGRIKIILTTRIPLFDKIMAEFSIHEELKEDLILGSLKQAEAYLACALLLGENDYKPSELAWLARRSGGVPLVITALCYTIKKSGSSSKIFEDKDLNFGQAIEKYVDEVIIKIKKETGLKSKIIKKCIWLLSIISPFTLQNKGQFIGNFLELKTSRLKKLLKALVKSFLLDEIHQEGMMIYYERDPEILLLDDREVQGDNQTYWAVPNIYYSIQPDPFADQIINWFTDDEKLMEELLSTEGVSPYLKNVIQNLFETKEINPGNSEVALRVLKVYIERLKEEIGDADLYYWDELLSIGKNLAHILPQYSFTILDAVMFVSKNRNHPIHKLVAEKEKEKSFLQYNLSSITQISVQLSISLNLIPEIFKRVLILSRAEGNWDLLKQCFLIRDVDLYQSEGVTPLVRQNSLLKLIMGNEISPKEQQEILVTLSEELLKTSFSQTIDVKERGELYGAMMFASLHLPDHPQVHEFRLNYLSILIHFFRSDQNPANREKILKAIVKAHEDLQYRSNRYIRAEEGSETFGGIEEAKKIIDFFTEIAFEVYGFLFRAKLGKERISTGSDEFHEIRDKYEVLFNQLETGKSIFEELSLMLYSGRNWTRDEDKFQKLISSYSNEEEAITDILKLDSYDQMFEKKGHERGASILICRIGGDSDLKLEILYPRLLELNQKLALSDGTDWLARIYFHDKGSKEFFRNKINFLLGIGSRSSLLSILEVYYQGILEKGMAKMTEDDFSTLKRIFSEFSTLVKSSEEGTIENRIHDKLSILVPLMVKSDRKEFLHYLLNFLSNACSGKTDHILGHFFDAENEFDEEFLIDLLYNHSPNLDIYREGYHLAKILDYFFAKRGFDWVLQFSERRLEIRVEREAEYANTYYGVYGKRNFDFNRPEFLKDIGNQNAIFKSALKWYMKLDSEKAHFLVEDPWQILRTFVSDTIDIDFLKDELGHWIGKNQNVDTIFRFTLALVLFRNQLSTLQPRIIEANRIIDHNFKDLVGKGTLDKYDLEGRDTAYIQFVHLLLRFNEEPFITGKERTAKLMSEILFSELHLFPKLEFEDLFGK